MNLLPIEFVSVILPFASLFSKRTWHSGLVLLMGAILAPGKRSVSAVLQVMGLSQERHFQREHRVLNRAVWSSRQASRILLNQSIAVFSPSGGLVIGIDDTTLAAQGQAHCSQRHLSRSSALVRESFCQGQRPALVKHDAAC
jgi:hypothetical protein